MSTRCHIIVKTSKEERYIYHHSDGYLAGVGSELKEFISVKYIPKDYTADEFCKQLENWDDSYEYEDSGIHGDEEYIYTINLNNPNITISVEEEEASFDKVIKSWNYTWKEIPEFTETFTIESIYKSGCSGYEIVEWPDSQNLIDKDGFKENCTLIIPNESMGVGSSTYLVSKKWLNSL